MPGDRRNVIDHFKYWSDEAIKVALDERRLPFAIMLENFAHDFNIACAIRNGNAFSTGEVWIVGRRKWDKRGAVGTYKYEHIHYADTSEEVIERFRERGYRIVAVDNLDGACELQRYRWEPKSLMMFGQESIGLSQRALDLADDLVYIPQTGSTRSINVGAASAVLMYDYVSKTVHGCQPAGQRQPSTPPARGRNKQPEVV